MITLTVADEFTVSASSMVINVVFSMTSHSSKNIHTRTTHCIMMKVPYTTARPELYCPVISMSNQREQYQYEYCLTTEEPRSLYDSA
jgi:hypothetical protein